MTKSSIVVTITNETGEPSIDGSRLREAVLQVLISNSVSQANIGVAIVSDEAIHRFNCQYLQHDYPTDVLSFPLSAAGDPLEGEIAVSLDTAATQAASYGWNTADELLLYVIHGTLHLVGYDDKSETSAAEMRECETKILAHFGLTHRYSETDAPGAPSIRA